MPSTNYAQLFQYDSERAGNLRVCLFELYKLRYPDTYAARMQAYGDVFEKHEKELLGFFGFSESDDYNAVARFAKKISDEVEKPNRQKLTIEEVEDYALEFCSKQGSNMIQQRRTERQIKETKVTCFNQQLK